MYDVDENGMIDLNEMTKLVRSIFKVSNQSQVTSEKQKCRWWNVVSKRGRTSQLTVGLWTSSRRWMWTLTASWPGELWLVERDPVLTSHWSGRSLSPRVWQTTVSCRCWHLRLGGYLACSSYRKNIINSFKVKIHIVYMI